MASINQFSRRRFLASSVALGAAASSRIVLLSNDVAAQPQLAGPQPFSRPRDHIASGKNAVVTSTSQEASEAALWALNQGGNAADAYMTAALVQAVVEHGLTSIAGGFSIKYFEAATQQIHSTVGLLGPAKAELYDFDRTSPVTQTGRAMPVPGFVAGLWSAHEQFGKSKWQSLFQPAIEYARDGFVVSATLASAAQAKGARFDEGKALWIRDGRFLQPGEVLVQKELGKTLQQVANNGPDAFYAGAFATDYVRRAAADGGKITVQDMNAWRDVVHSRQDQAEGDYRGYQVSSAALVTYALHLLEALDLRTAGPAKSSPDALFRQFRIMEEVFLATREYSAETHERYVSPEYARERATFVLESPLRPLTFDAIFNTCFLVVRDRDGNMAWGTHSINTPTAFGAGILVNGVYAAHAMDRKHVSGSGGSAPGISTSFALLKDGRPRLIAGSPGFGFVHGPWQFGTALIEWELSPAEAISQPRFGLPRQDGNIYFENHYDDSIFQLLADRQIPFYKGRPSPFTGLVGALIVDDDGTAHAVQDGRRDGFALAE